MGITEVDLVRAMPPLDAVMPATAQIVILFAFGGLSLAFLLYAVYLSIRWKNWLPTLFWFGGLTAVMVEPIADLGLHAIHPPVGQLNAFTTHGHPIPLHILFAYPAYYAGSLIALWPMIAKRTLTSGFAWKIFWISVVWVAMIEQVPLFYGIWVYYGPHAFKIGLMPISMIVPNAASVVMVLLIVYKLAPAMNNGWKRLIAIPAVGISALGTHVGSAALMYNVMGMNLEKFGPVFLNLMALISVALGVVAVWMTIELTRDKSDTSAVLAEVGDNAPRRMASAAP